MRIDDNSNSLEHLKRVDKKLEVGRDKSTTHRANSDRLDRASAGTRLDLSLHLQPTDRV
jgi:hypothetical protein